MHKITRAFWDKGTTLREWARTNDFNWRYVELVIARKRGSWGVGTAKRIKDALIEQGFAVPEDFNKAPGK